VAAQTLDRGDVHHGAAAGLLHEGYGVARGDDHGLEVDFHDPVPDRQIDVDQRLVAVEPQHACGIDDVVEAAGLVKGVGDGLVDEGLLGDVPDQVERAIN